MKSNSAVILRHSYFAVVIGEDLEFDHLTIESSKALEGQLGSIKYFDLRGIDACSNDVALVLGDLYLVGGDLELEILDEFDSPAVLLIISQGLAGFLCLVEELGVGLASGHVVGLHAIDLCYFVHQQSIL